MKKDIIDLTKAVAKDKPELDKVYYGKNVLSGNYQKFVANLDKDEKEHKKYIIPTNESKFYYDNQMIKQVFTPHEDPKHYIHILAYYPFEKVYLDTMYLKLKNSTLAILNIMDLFTKYAYSWCGVLPKRSQAIPSELSTKVFNEFMTEINDTYPDYKIGFVVTDRGSEFLGDFMKNLEQKDIPHIYANAGDKRKTSPIERFNKTLRLYLEKYRVINGKINNKTLKEILYAYNNSKTLSTGFTPIELLNDKTKDDTVENHNILLERENKDEILPNGTSVRVLLTVSPFQKIKPVWSYEIYKVKSYSQSNYQLEGKDGYYKRDHLEVVNPKFLLNKEKVSPTDLNTELENIDYADIPIVKDKKSVFKLEHAGNNDLNKSERINRGNIYKNVDIKDIKKSTKSKKKKKE